MSTTARLIMDDGTDFPITGTVTLGRSDACEIQLSSGKVSRQHARITVTDAGLLLEDLGSANGTRINGMVLDGQVALMDGDKVAIDRFELRVSLAPEAGMEDATELAMPEDDATELAMASAEAEPAAAPDAALPGSWVENTGGEHTEFFGGSGGDEDISVARHSDLPHLLLLGEGDSVQAVFELEIDGAQEEQAWIIGREGECDLVVEDPTVSSRHAQLVHGKDRWRMVNLVSSNGILVNGEKRLSVYLASGDTVQLGRSRLVFFDGAAVQPAAVAARAAAPAPAASAQEHRRVQPLLPWLAGAALLVAAAAAAVLLGG
jgi:pSer/pThr/pTyr-binding forkhead associated (FHA) protein